MTGNLVAWDLSFIANAYTRAKRLEVNRSCFHKELYEAIIIPAIRYGDDYVPGRNPSTDAQAIRIIELKERYERKIEKEYERFNCWENFLNNVKSDKDRFILIRYFQKNKFVGEMVIESLLERLCEEYQNMNVQIVQNRNIKAREELKVILSDFPKSTFIPLENEHEGKKEYLIAGEFLYFTDQEYNEKFNKANVVSFG